MNDTTIILDYGHGGIDATGRYTTAPGKQAMVSGVMVHEGVLNRRVGGMLHHLFTWHGYTVKETVKANDAKDVSLADRVRIMNSIPKAIVLSIHHNASNGKGRGFELFTTKGQNKSDLLAESIANTMQPVCERYKLPTRWELIDGDRDKEVDHYVTRKSIHPAVLLECLFFDNAEDMKLHNNKEFLTNQVAAIFYGTINFLKQNKWKKHF